MKTQMKVWISPYSDLGPSDLSDPANLKNLTYTHCDMGDGYTLVGIADVETTLLPVADLIDQKRQAIEAQLQKEIADSHIRQEKYREQIQNLLALPNEVEA